MLINKSQKCTGFQGLRSQKITNLSVSCCPYQIFMKLAASLCIIIHPLLMFQMGSHEAYLLKWDNYLTHIVKEFHSFKTGNELVDVTLSCQGKRIGAHKMLLSACSPYFKDLFRVIFCFSLGFTNSFSFSEFYRLNFLFFRIKSSSSKSETIYLIVCPAAF